MASVGGCGCGCQEGWWTDEEMVQEPGDFFGGFGWGYRTSTVVLAFWSLFRVFREC